MFLKLLQNSQENTCARVSFLISCKLRLASFLTELAIIFSVFKTWHKGKEWPQLVYGRYVYRAIKSIISKYHENRSRPETHLNSINGHNFKYLVYSLNGDSHHKYMLENISFQRPTYDTARKGHSLLGGSCPLPF